MGDESVTGLQRLSDFLCRAPAVPAK